MHRRLLIGRWNVDFLFEVHDYDIEEVLSYLRDIGASTKITSQAYQLMRSGSKNTGFTYTDARSKYAFVVIGPSDSGDEFIDTLVHEVHHLAVAIAASLGVDLDGEAPAYLSGDSARELASIICELGCQCKR